MQMTLQLIVILFDRLHFKNAELYIHLLLGVFEKPFCYFCLEVTGVLMFKLKHKFPSSVNVPPPTSGLSGPCLTLIIFLTFVALLYLNV